MIVKVQASMASSDGGKHCLIYDKTKDVYYQTSEPEEVKPLLEVLKNRPKAYFKAEVVDTKIQLREEVKAQNW